jgi:toxin ParE1/3/4
MRIEWSRAANKDLDNIHRYISADSVFYAAATVAKLARSTKNLAKFPNLGHRVKDVPDESVRELIVLDYRLIYRISSDVITIAAVIHASRDFKTILAADIDTSVQR